MADKENKKDAGKRIDDSQRFRYIGFEVCPGKPRDLFKSESEKKLLVEAVVAKRDKGDVIREHCTLFEERVSFSDRMTLGIACLVIFASLFIPWYSAYNEIVEETIVPVEAEMFADSTMTAAATGDSALMTTTDIDNAALAVTGETETEAIPDDGTVGDTAILGESDAVEEVVLGIQARKRIHKEFTRLSGIGAFLALGNVGGRVFSSGIILVLTGILLIVYTLLCIVLPALTLYTLYGSKGSPDVQALKLKKILRYNWIPVIMFIVTLVISFVGAQYGFDPTGYYDSLGADYGIAALFNSLSWGVFIPLCGFILMAAKGIEI
ncbi:MAG: hypothetical protein ABII79_03535 [bacterium]